MSRLIANLRLRRRRWFLTSSAQVARWRFNHSPWLSNSRCAAAMTRPDSLNALLARAISSPGPTNSTRPWPPLLERARQVQGRKNERISSSPSRLARRWDKERTPVPDAQALLHPCRNQSAKLLRKTEVPFKKA